MTDIKFHAIATVLGLCCAVLPTVADASDMDAIIKSCAGCHGADGVSTDPDMPSIAGMSIAVHEDAWFTYQDEARPCEASKPVCDDCAGPVEETDMCRIAADLDEEQIVAIADHFAQLPHVAMKQDFDASKASAGKVIHDEACEKCHTDGGGNADDDAGLLSGQARGYLERTFAEYAAGKREQPKKMKDKMDPLSSDDVDALVHYYISQQ